MDLQQINQYILDLNNSSWDIRRQSKTSLIKMGKSAMSPLITAFHENKLDRFGIELAIEILGELGDTGVVDLLIDILNTRDVHFRLAAVIALGKLKDTRAVQPLIESFRAEVTDEDTDIELWIMAARALGQLGNAAFEPLIAALIDNNNIVRAGVADALGQLGDRRAVNALIIALRDPDPQVRFNAIDSLGELHDSRASEPIIEFLSHQDYIFRCYALRALGKLRGADVFDHIVRSLDDLHISVKQAAITALGELGDDRSLELLLELLHNPDVEMRGIAALALGTLGDSRALPALEQAQKYDVGQTRDRTHMKDYAQTAIKRIQRHSIKQNPH